MQDSIVFDKENIDYHLYLVADKSILGNRNFIESIEDAIKGGVSLIQLREKTASSLNFYKLATEVKNLTDKYNIPLIINDRLDIALAVNAAGLHIGQDDIPAKIARKILGPDKILGLSAANLEEAIKAKEDGADYLGVGAMFPTSSKDDAKYVSLDVLKSIKQAVRMPIVAIGGISEENVTTVMQTEIDGIAVISAILKSKDIKTASQRLHKLVLNNLNE